MAHPFALRKPAAAATIDGVVVRCSLLSVLLLAAGKAPPAMNSVEPERVLMVVSSATEIRLADGTAMPVGYWASEVEVPLTRLRAAGYVVDVVTPGGRTPSPDPVSLPKDPEKATAARASLSKLAGILTPGSLEALDSAAVDRYAAVVIPGGYAPMVDLAASSALRDVLMRMMMHGKVVAAICHGPAAFLSTKRPPAPWPFAGYRMAAFTNAEEEAWLKERKLSWRVMGK